MDSESPGRLKELTISRARFIAELGERIATLRQGLARMATSADPTVEVNAVRRRLHALAAAAEVLRFTPAAGALAGAEAALAGAGQASSMAPARERAGRVLDLLPSLVLGVPIDLGAALDSHRQRALRDPLCVVVYGDDALEALLHKPGPLHGVETHLTGDPDQVLTLMAEFSPDVVLLDGDDAQSSELLPRIRQAARAGDVPVVAVGSFDRHEPLLRLVRRGVSRIQPRPSDPGTLQRTLRQVSKPEAPSPSRPASFRRLTPDELIEAITAEARKAFGHSGSSARSAAAMDFGSGAEVLASLWAAFARIRGLAVATSDGAVSFPLVGPHGAVPMAPATLSAAAEGPPRARPASTVTLAGRRFVVVDDDPGILALLSRVLQQLGAAVLPARGAAHALELAARHWPDAVISDTLMPGVDGFELCRRIRDDIALADLPVALVAWKDHLLERSRSSGDAHARSGSALDPASVAPALEACLVDRAQLEQRLARHDDVHGRLDGVTPRLLLQLVCSRMPNALLTVRSGRLRYELWVQDGRPVHARLHEEDRCVSEGEAVLGPFLGVRAGRFSVRPSLSAFAVHFSGDLMTVLEPVILRARRVRDRLESSHLAGIERVELDPYAVAQFFEDSSTTQRGLVAQLGEGVPLRLLSPSSEAPDGGDDPRLVATLLELARRGAVVALLDDDGRDLLALDASGPAPMPAKSSPAPSQPAPSVPGATRGSPPVLALGEAVLRAVSAPAGASAARTHPGLAPPSPAEARPDPERASDAVRSAPLSAAPPEPQLEPREVPEAWSSEPEEEDDDNDDGAARLREMGDDPGEPRSTSFGGRLRSAAGPLLVTLGAGALAFAGIVGVRALAGGAGPEPLRAALKRALPVIDGDAGQGAPSTLPAPSLDDLGLLAEQRKVPLNVTFSSELLPLPAGFRLRPGHGLLEVRTWEPQRIYVDGVFMGNYETRLIPLNPGTYQLRLRDGARDMERSVQVEAGRRTRLWARPKSPQ